MTRILVPVDGSDPASAALTFAIDQFPTSTIIVLYVIDSMVDHSRRQSYPRYTSPNEFTTKAEKVEAVLQAATDRHSVSLDRLETECTTGTLSARR
jgi:nucleotide-binding universal stress UspA family protein